MASFASVSTGVRSPVFSQNLEKSPTAGNKDSVVYYVNTSYDLIINSLKNMDAGKLSDIHVIKMKFLVAFILGLYLL